MQSLIALVELGSRTPVPLAEGIAALLNAFGARGSTARLLVPDVLPAASAMLVLDALPGMVRSPETQLDLLNSFQPTTTQLHRNLLCMLLEHEQHCKC